MAETPPPAPAAAAATGLPPAAASPPQFEAGVSILRSVPRFVSLAALLGVLVFIAVMFFRMIASFLVPLFLAAVLAVVFKPLHAWVLEKVEGRNWLAALATTLLISLGVVVPTVVLGWMAFLETQRIVRVVKAASTAESTLAPPAEAESDKLLLPESVVGDEPADAADATAEGEGEGGGGWAGAIQRRLEPLLTWFHDNVSDTFDPAQFSRAATENAVKLGVYAVQALAGFILGLCVMVFALYFFFADGPKIIDHLMHLSPLDIDYVKELLDRFASVSRAVVVAILLAAFVQGILGGIGYFFVLEEWTPPSLAAAAEAAGRPVAPFEKVSPPVFLLTVLTMLLAIIPFVGATAVWIPVALWVYFVQEDTWAAAGMTAYGFGVVSSIDNVIKPYVLHGQSNLHPLLALLSVLGGLKLLGPVGILVGPMLVAFLQALLLMLRKELDVLASHGEPVAPSA